MSFGLRYAALLEDNPLTLADRILGNDVAAITQATINTISFRVWEYASWDDAKLDRDGSEIGTQASLDKTIVVFDTLQTDAYWESPPGSGNAIDDTGYNFRATIPPARFPSAAKWYRVEITFTPTAGDAFKIVWVASTTAVAST